MNDLVIAAMTKAEVDEVAELERKIYPFPWTRGNFVDSLAAGYSAWVARDEQSLVGYAVLLVAANEAQLLNISVAPDKQRCGLGQKLFAQLRDAARAQQAGRMFLEVRRSNGGAQSFYRKIGFCRIGERRRYYPSTDGREDAIVMELVL